MKRLRHINPKVQAKIVAEYKEKLPDGSYRFTLREIAALNEVSLSTVNLLARQANVQERPQGPRKLQVPSARVLKILRDATEPGITLAQVGIRNARVVVVNGKQVARPLSKQRVKQIIDFWKRRGNPGLKSRGFKPGDIIEWNERRFKVLRFDNARKGAVIDLGDNSKIDPFLWVFQGCRSRRVENADGHPATE